MADKSAGTLTVGVVAPTSVLDQNMKQGEQIVQRFRRSFEDQARAVARSSDRMGEAAALSGTSMAKGLRAGVAGLALLSQASDGVAGDFTRLAGNIATGFAVGGPAGGAVAALSEGFAFVAKRIRDGREEAEKMRVAVARIESERRQQESASAVAAARAIGKKFESLREFQLEQARLAKRAGMTPEQLAQADREDEIKKARETWGEAGVQSVRDRQAAEAAGGARGKEAADVAERRRSVEDGVNRSLGERERMLRIEARLAPELLRWASDYAQIQDLIASGQTEQANRLKAIVADEQRRAKAVADAEKAKGDAKRTAEAQSRLDADAARRVRDLQAQTDLERLLNRQADERNDAAAQGVKLGELLKSQAYEVALLKTREANEAERVRAATERQAEAQRDVASQIKRAAEEQKAADAAAARTAQMNAFGAGYGPLAQARDAKRRNANMARFKNHADNLAAEARARPTAGNGQPWQVGAPQFDSDGNPIGVRDPFASDLGSIFDRRTTDRRSGFPVFQAPGLFNPAYQFPDPAAPPMGGGPAAGPATPGGPPSPVLTESEPNLSAAGDAVKAGGEAARAAGEKTKAAAEKMASGADEIAEGSGSIADNVGAMSETVGAIANGVMSMAEAIDQVKGDLESLKATFAAAGFLGAGG